ncbi:DUF6868 family protein [Colwellia ponticola]|uniref:DUF6868 domain-containing protein n=1 Tax=Colwellia ponticola TaxID=2304625 RepID=A0A8H2JK06_9GAMM|nr:hypothetical protein [Colwellia ponticola]TMM43992.1 hypothetical protein FCS21_11325 [Colwellia ponticola]
MDINVITAFFGWCLLINVAIYSLSTLLLFTFNDWIIKLHSNISGVNACELPRLYFQYLAHFKIAITVFSLVPYLALKLLVN